jgi:hypothetical protein
MNFLHSHVRKIYTTHAWRDDCSPSSITVYQVNTGVSQRGEKPPCTAQALRCILRGKRDGWWILRLKWLLG